MASVSAIDLLLHRHFTTILLASAFGIKLYSQKQSKEVELRYFWLTLLSCALLVFEDVAESIASLNPRFLLLRILFSVLGYSLRPVAAVGLLLVICPPEKRSWKVWFPCVINSGIFCTAFFSPLTFSYNDNYEFIRGPLGYIVLVLGFLYMLQILVGTLHRFYDVKGGERWSLILCAVSCILGALVDMYYWGSHLNEAILISSIFFFLYLNSHDNRTDPLTALGNRFAFYEDMEYLNKAISAVASLDMNGLKHINDTQGHAAGDRALVEIGTCLHQLSNRSTTVYRVGGDEFVILFQQADPVMIQRVITQAKEDVARAGYSISAGFALRSGDESIETTLQRSDQSMYGDKAAFYQSSGRDRRRR